MAVNSVHITVFSPSLHVSLDPTSEMNICFRQAEESYYDLGISKYVPRFFIFFFFFFFT